jgi:hypothetical protein
MHRDYTDLSPYQRIGSAFNEVSNAKPDLPGHLQGKADVIMLLMDQILAELCHGQTNDPIPLCDINCGFCGSDHERL